MTMRWTLAALLLASVPAERAPSVLFVIADDWGFGHAGAYGDRAVKTPNFDRVAREGALFTRSFCASPSCTPSRAAILTGQAIHRLDESGNLWSTLQTKHAVYPDLLEKAGYAVGLRGKGWGPGDFKPGGFTRNPAGPPAKSFAEFLKSVRADQPFCFWFGSTDPHRTYEKGSGVAAGIRLEDIAVPPWLPDAPEVRSDIADYLFEVQRFDRDLGEHLKLLDDAGRAAETIVVVTSDNGMPFPRAKTNLHDSGTRMPLAIRWPAKVKAGRTIDEFVSHCDFAPTFLEVAGLPVAPAMTGRSLLPLLRGEGDAGRDRIFVGRERHANVRKGDLSYPARAIRTKDWLYIRNFAPERWPGGDPEKHVAVGPYGDCDGGPTKDLVLAGRDGEHAAFYRLAFEKRPAQELYDLAKDPDQVRNVATEHPEAASRLDAELKDWLSRTSDPRAANPADERWDRFPYYGR
jgi:arylsulfatase A-like enzyme